MKKILLVLLSVILIASCSNNSQNSRAIGLAVSNVGYVFADPDYSYDAAYRNGSEKYIAEVTVELSNGTYRYPSSIKADIYVYVEEEASWKNAKDAGYIDTSTGKIVFNKGSKYKVKYSAEGFTTDEMEFQVYEPGKIYDFKPAREKYAAGALVQRNDFSYRYCYKSSDGRIGLTNSASDAEGAFYYLVDNIENPGIISIIDVTGNTPISEKYQGDMTMAGLIVVSGEDEYDSAETEIKVATDGITKDFRNAAYCSKSSSSQYEFRGTVFRRFKDGNTIIGKNDVIKFSNGDAILDPDYKVSISKYYNEEEIQEEGGIGALYANISSWTPITEEMFAPKIDSDFGGKPGGIYLLKIEQGNEVLTKGNPAYIKVSK